MQILNNFLIGSVVLLFMNCRNNSAENDCNNIVGKPGFALEIPRYLKGPSAGQPDHRFQWQCVESSTLGLQSLTEGYDSLQIRIWLGHSMAITKEVVVLKYSNGKWSGNLISYSPMENDSGKQYSLIRSKRRIYPASGWKLFVDNLYKLQLLTLPNADELEGYDGCGADGIGYTFEWATNSKYRFYYYCNPDSNTEKFWQARNVLKIAELLETEFNFTYIK